MTREEIRALVIRWQQELGRRDAVALANLYSETCIVESPTAGGPVTGRTAVAQVFDAWFNAFSDSLTTFEDPLIDGDRAAFAGTSSGTETGRFLGLPPTGKPFKIPVVILLTVKDNLIVHDRRIYDFTGMLIQIGVLKAKPA